jgi:hypothetical protein
VIAAKAAVTGSAATPKKRQSAASYHLSTRSAEFGDGAVPGLV